MLYSYLRLDGASLLFCVHRSIIMLFIDAFFVLQRADALDLVCAAISAGIFNDLGSGSNVDACVITASHTEMLRNFVKPNERVQKERSYTFRRGTTEFKKEEIRALIVEEDVTYISGGRAAEGEAMDTS